MYNHGVDVLLLQELNTNMKHPDTKKFFQPIHQRYKHMQYVWSHTPFTTRSLYKPGRTGIWIKYPNSRYITHRIQDVIGRWTGVTLTFANLQVITILSVYQPPKQQQTQGTTNVTAKQTRWFIYNNIKSTIRQCFRRDLNKLIYNLIQQKHKIVIGGDFNEHSAYNNILQDITEKYKLIDIISISDDVDKPTYKHGPHILDKMFLSRELVTSQTKAQLEDYNSIEESDHRPISVCTWINYIKEDQDHLRKLTTNNLKALTTYIQKVYSKMVKHVPNHSAIISYKRNYLIRRS
jgi:endonuclease/exonuclease/phosphatase family metal-dependent hydrolase